MAHPSKLPEEERWWEKHKIVVWWKHGDEIGDDFGCGDSPDEVVEFMRNRHWTPEIRDDSKKYMSEVQTNLSIFNPVTFLFHDAESFLYGLVKIGELHIQKWDWEPEYDTNSDHDTKGTPM